MFTEMLVAYVGFLFLTISIGCIPIWILYNQIRKHQSTVVIKKVIKSYVWFLYTIFGINLVFLQSSSALYVVPLFILVYTFGIISMQTENITIKYYCISVFFILITLIIQIFFIINFEDIGGMSDIYNILGLSTVFILQIGTSVSFLTFLYIKTFYITDNPLTITLTEILISSNNSEDCAICLESLSEIKEKGVVKTNCNHTYHKVCIERHYQNNYLCPLCRGDMREHQCF